MILIQILLRVKTAEDEEKMKRSIRTKNDNHEIKDTDAKKQKEHKNGTKDLI